MSKRTDTPNRPKLPKRQFDSYIKYSALATQMIAIMVMGVLGGRKLDQWLELKYPIFTLVLTLLSVFFAIYFAVKDFLGKGKKK